MGKSTLVNRLVGQHVAIVSDKVQTTRHRIMGVLHLPAARAQVVFLDTPGMHKPRHRLGEWMVRVAQRSLSDVEVICFVVDGSFAHPGPGDRHVAEYLAAVQTPVLLVVNKIDQVEPERVDDVVANYSALGDFAAVLPVSALTGTGLNELLAAVLEHLPHGPPYFPADTYTDQPEQLLVAELVREQVLHLTRDEIPHSVSVEIEEMKTRANGTVFIRAVIYVERESQKGIIIGGGGRLLRQIGTGARQNIEPLLGAPVYLDLWVKVKKDWRDREASLRALGYEPG